jgi:hypothetical protein
VVTFDEALRVEEAYHSRFISATKILHHDCMAATPHFSSTSTRLPLPPNLHAKDAKIKACTHGFKAKGTRKRTVIRDGLSVWVFEWVSDGVSQPRFVTAKEECFVGGIMKGEGEQGEVEGTAYELKKMGWREGMEVVRQVRRLGETNYVEYVH